MPEHGDVPQVKNCRQSQADGNLGFLHPRRLYRLNQRASERVLKLGGRIISRLWAGSVGFAGDSWLDLIGGAGLIRMVWVAVMGSYALHWCPRHRSSELWWML